MKKITKFTAFFSIVCLFLFLTYNTIYSTSSGMTGRTKKHKEGCTCHYPENSVPGGWGIQPSAPSQNVSVVITGPTFIEKGKTVSLVLIISNQNKSAAGLDIATRQGKLTPVTPDTRQSDPSKEAPGEITHSIPLYLIQGSVSVTFNYTAPNFECIDTIWATGNTVNSNGKELGDEWNFAPSHQIIVKNPLTISSFQPTKAPVGATITVLGNSFGKNGTGPNDRGDQIQFFIGNKPVPCQRIDENTIKFTVTNDMTSGIIYIRTQNEEAQSQQIFTVIHPLTENVNGVWISGTDKYEITQTASHFLWKLQGTTLSGNGSIDANNITADWKPNNNQLCMNGAVSKRDLSNDMPLEITLSCGLKLVKEVNIKGTKDPNLK